MIVGIQNAIAATLDEIRELCEAASEWLSCSPAQIIFMFWHYSPQLSKTYAALGCYATCSPGLFCHEATPPRGRGLCAWQCGHSPFRCQPQVALGTERPHCRIGGGLPEAGVSALGMSPIILGPVPQTLLPLTSTPHGISQRQRLKSAADLEEHGPEAHRHHGCRA